MKTSVPKPKHLRAEASARPLTARATVSPSRGAHPQVRNLAQLQAKLNEAPPVTALAELKSRINANPRPLVPVSARTVQHANGGQGGHTVQLVRKAEGGWFTKDDLGPFETQALAEHAELDANKGKAELVTRWLRFKSDQIPVKKPGTFIAKSGETFKGGNNGMRVWDKDEQRLYFIKGYRRENVELTTGDLPPSTQSSGGLVADQDIVPDVSETTEPQTPTLEELQGHVPQAEDLESRTSSSGELETGLASSTDSEPQSPRADDMAPKASVSGDAGVKQQLDALVKLAMKNKKAIYEYVAIESYAQAGLEPPFRSHLFQDDEGRIFVANDWTPDVKSVLADERRTGKRREKESDHDRWFRAKPDVQKSEAFRKGLAMDLVFGMHDLLNVDNWKYVGKGKRGAVKPFDFGGPFDVRATALGVEEGGAKQGKEGWELPANINAIGRWLNTAALSMLAFGDKSEANRKKSVYSGVPEETLRRSAEFMNARWDGLLRFVETTLLEKGVHQEDVKELVNTLQVRVKTMKMLAANELPKGEYLSWNPAESLASKFKGLQADPSGRLDRLHASQKSGPLVATVPREPVDGGGLMHTGLVETEHHSGMLCVRVYQTAFAPLSDETVDKQYKDVYQDPLTHAVEISAKRKSSGEMAATCFGVGQPLRALKWVERYMTQHGVNADAHPVVRSFLVPYESYLDLLQNTVQQGGKLAPHGRMQNVDFKSATDQFEMTEQHIERLQQDAVADTLQTYVVTEPEALKASKRIEHGAASSMRALYDKVGVPVFADTLANKYHPWLSGEGHLTQDSAQPKRKDLNRFVDAMSRLDSLTLKPDPDADTKDPIVAAELKQFLVQHVGIESRHLRAIQREIVHQRNTPSRRVPRGIGLDLTPEMTERDRRKIQASEIVKFFMHEIVGSALTQLEILSQHGSWSAALAQEEKPQRGEGPEVYAYGTIDSEVAGPYRAQHHVRPNPIGSLRQKLADMYTLDKFGPVASRPERLIPVLEGAGLLKGRSEEGRGLLASLIESDELTELLPEDQRLDLYVSLGIYGDAWLSAAQAPHEVPFSRGRRSEGSAEYLTADLEEIAKDRIQKEGKPAHVVRAEINAELGAIPALEGFTDKNLRISPTHPSSGKHRTDITPYVDLAGALARIREGNVGSREDMEKQALQAALTMIKKITKETKEFVIWKTVTREITKNSGGLAAARTMLDGPLSRVNKFEKLDDEITKLDAEVDETATLGFDLFATEGVKFA
jgi:hypothetical protein